MKIKPTGRGFEVAATIPRVVGVPTIAPALDDSGEAPLVYESVSGALYVFDPVSKAWVLAGSGGGGGAVSSVNGQTGAVTIPAALVYCDGVSTGSVQLSTLASAGYTEGQTAYVATLKSNFVLTASTQSASALVRVAAFGKSGYLWIRQDGAPSWWSNLSWFVNPATGSDEANGITAGTPLATLAEFSRRFRGRNLPGTETNSFSVTLQADAADTDYFQVHLGSNYRNAAINVTLQGTVTSVVAVGVIASAVAKNAATNTANSITVTGFDFSTHIGQLVRLVGTATTNAVIEAAPSLGVAQLSEQNVNGSPGTGFTAGQTVEIPVMTKLPGITAEGGQGIQVIVSDCVMNPAGAVFITVPGTCVLSRVELRGGSSGSLVSTGQNGAFTLLGSSIVGRAYTVVGLFTPTAGAVVNGSLNLQGAAGRHHLASYGLQNSTLSANDGAIVRLNGDFHCFGLASGAIGLTMRPGATAYFAGAYYGSGNNAASVGLLAFFDARVMGTKSSMTMDAGIGCYVDGIDGLISGGTSVTFASLPYPASGGPSARGVLIAAL